MVCPTATMRTMKSLLSPQEQATLTKWITSGQARDWRIGARLTQVDASLEVGVSWTTICAWEARPKQGKKRREPTGYHELRYYECLQQWRARAKSSPPKVQP